MKSKILLLEDDLNLSETVSDYFEEQGFDVICVYDGEEAISSIYEHNFDLLLLDVNVPNKNGFEVLKEIRAQNKKVPAIFITSLNSMDSLEKGFESGCDDYIRKPFELKELLLRVQTILKREFANNKNELINITPEVTFNSISNELRENGVEVKLNLKELKLLKFFLQHPNELLVHDRIYDYVWDYDEEYSDNSLRTYIKNLRKILGKDKIVSLKKLGYRFNQE
ncbi:MULTISPECIES: response regulator transcription factor [Arcobacter]|jgi:DNA-binding response OmpR family regulator|uniref:Two-component system response regulator n=1 Tax=Arcobacter ellisii TaxID=913109 RepID=A0A347U922_9BACT|nr:MULTISPECIES: response regulator transcription factor [Arcobacter]AXX95350.1 two-component system response regulator [Arcobacter ellisii]MDD3008165.1 response regulator transcription factor [Arcobacter sp.]MDY3205362.1 response regulator transcription factor [Arcobacter sp.]RXI29523.1 two-component system response regulator [Arcobacter ellisii]